MGEGRRGEMGERRREEMGEGRGGEGDRGGEERGDGEGEEKGSKGRKKERGGELQGVSLRIRCNMAAALSNLRE